MKKAIFIGLILALIFSIGGIVGTYKCQWNPAHYVNKGEICLVSGFIFYVKVSPENHTL